MSEAESEFTIRQIETAIDALIAAKTGKPLTAAQIIRELGGKKLKALADRVDRTLAGDDRFFDDGRGNFTCRSDFFHHYEFLVTPDAWEIEQGWLFPGHRFTAYVNPEVFPSEVILTGPDGKAVKLETVNIPVSQVFHHHLLLGSEQIFDFLTAESAANAHLSRNPQPSDLVTLNVFDLKEFYRKNKFSAGDALLCRVEEWGSGAVSFRCLSGSDRREADLKSWITAYEKALSIVFDRFENYPEIPEQLAYACFFGAGTLPEAAKSASLDEFVRRTNEVEINFDSDHTVLAKRPDNADEYPLELPEGVAVSRGETGEIGALLREIGSPLTPVEVDGYILDCCYARELDFEEFFARAFGREKLNFIDEGQQAVFYNYIEDRFEELTGSYNRVDDEPKAPLRSSILELVDDRLEFFDFLASLGKKLDKLPHEEMHKLAAISMQLDEILKMLNDPGCTPDAGDLDRLSEAVELRTDEQETLISELTGRLEEDGE
ncbi:MAG: hypothetical protein HPZ91_05125 [Lentisphaeria bacterium]|nr:hypothetical protein [Lentisphaeria bacterium]